ncbi:MAG: hypothetical protein IT422_16910 [Pirellulaceae bacterium]|nr:hypothetical protein [Pirellulaceae bacterium]
MRAILFCSCLVLGTTCVLANEPNRQESPDRLQQVLQSEAGGTAVDRRSSLGEVDGLGPTARWHVGQFEHRGKWLNFEDLDEAVEPLQLQRYRQLRSEMQADVENHRRLALWCQSQKLDAQATAHWHAVLAFSPNDVQARMALKDAWIDGQWFSLEERERVADASQRIEAEWTKWIPRLQKIVENIVSTSTERTKRGLAALDKIDDPAAISSLEITSQQLADDQALPFVQAIGRIQSKAACLACCRIAMERSGEPAGEMAIKQVKAYPQEMYVPELLSLLLEPTQTEVEYQVNAKGELLIHRALIRETMNEKQAVYLQRLVRINAPVSQIQNVTGRGPLMQRPGIETQPGALAAGMSAPSQISADEIAASQDALEAQKQFEQRLQQSNAELKQSSQKVYRLLAKTTGQGLAETPAAWWAWWRESNGQTLARKPLRESNYQLVDQARVQVNYALLGQFRVHECLVYGTLVQTQSGLRPIESIQVGDLVLSQNVESGELCLKPVIKTTIRPPLSTLRMVTEAGEIQATAGHRWFVSGKGWLMTKELQPDMLLHNASGTTRIVSMIADPLEQETYNLVVDGFHTYFVGPERVLSYDNSELQPTLRAVPGYGQIVLTQ